MLIKPLIVEIHAIVHPNLLEKCECELIKTLKGNDMLNYGVFPLYITSDMEDTEFRICLQFEDPVKLEKLIVEKIRPVKGVVSTRVRLTLNGKIFKKGVSALADLDSTKRSCHIFLKIDPSKDKYVWESLLGLKDEDKVFPTWIFRDFYEYERDVTLRVMGDSVGEIRKYIDEYVSIIDGLQIWNCKSMKSIKTIAKKEDLLGLAKKWFDV